MPVRDARPSFNAGEISDEADARFDISKYSSACEILENFMPMPTGGARKRPGSIYVAETKNSGAGQGRLVPFRFSTGTNFVLLFEAGTIRFFSNQVEVQSGGSAYEVVNPYTESQLFDLHFSQINDVVYVTHPEVAPYKLTRLADTDWTFEEIDWVYPPMLSGNFIPDVTIASSTTDVGTTATLTVAGETWVDPKAYVVGDYVQSASGTTLIYKCLVPHNSSENSDFAVDLAAGRWELYEVFTSGNVGGYFEISQPKAAFSSEIADLDANATEQSPWIKVRGAVDFYTSGIWDGTLTLQKSLDGGTTTEDILVWTSGQDFNGETAISFGDTVSVRWSWVRASAPASGPNPRAVIEPESITTDGIVKITAVASSISVTATVKIALESTDATRDWSEGSWSTRRGFPQSVAIHEQRLCFGGTTHQAQTIWLSQTDDYQDFFFGTAADDAFSISIGSRNFNGIQWLESKGPLMVGTTGGEFAVEPASDSNPLGPTNVSIKNNTNYGSNTLQPALVNESALYSARANYAIMELSVDAINEKLVSPELTLLSNHLLTSGITQMDVQRGKWTTLYCTTGDGYMAGMTYERSQDVVAWFKHRTLAGDTIESVATIYGSGEDEVWMVTKRANGSGSGYVRTVEYLDFGAWIAQDAGDVRTSAFCDCATVYDGASTTTVTVPSFLIGSSLTVLADGGVVDAIVPTSTTVTIPNAATKIVIGLPYSAKIQPTRPEIALQNGSSSGAKKRIANIYAKLKASGYVNVYAHDDTTLSKATLITAHTTGETAGVAPDLLTGVYRAAIANKHQIEPGYVLISDSPLPCTVLSLIHEFSVGNRT